MVDRTSNTIFYTKAIPGIIFFKTNASDGDTFKVPHGVAEGANCSTTDNDDVIASAVCSGSQVTIGLIDDAGSAETNDSDIVGFVILKTQ